MERQFQTCDNCKKQIETAKIATHFGYCRRNILICERCNEPYDKNFKDDHEQQFHKMQICEFCVQKFAPSQITQHKNVCEKRTNFCQYCELKIPYKTFDEHKKKCEARTQTCQKCRKAISKKQIDVHNTICEGPEEFSIPTHSFSNYLKRNKRNSDTHGEKLESEIKYDYSHKVPKKKKKKLVIDSDEEDDSYVPQEQSYRQSLSHYQKFTDQVYGDAQQKQLQKALMLSMAGQKQKDNNFQAQLDFDPQEQKAILNEIYKNNKKK